MTDATIIGATLGAAAEQHNLCADWDALLVELNGQLEQPIPHRFTPTRAFNVWADRLVADTWQKGWIRQWYQHILPRAAGHRAGGKATALTDHECDILDRAFISRRNRPPRVSDEQAEQGSVWLHRYAVRRGGPNLDYLKIDHFDFVGCIEVSSHIYHVSYAPQYRAVWANGDTLTYSVTAWQTGNTTIQWYYQPTEREQAA